MVAPKRLITLAVPPSCSPVLVELLWSTWVRTPAAFVTMVREALFAVEVARENWVLLKAIALPPMAPELSTAAEPSPLAVTPPNTRPVALIVASAAPPDSECVELPLDSKVPSDRLMERLWDALLVPLVSTKTSPSVVAVPTCPAMRAVAEPAVLPAPALPVTRPVAVTSSNAAPPFDILDSLILRSKVETGPPVETSIRLKLVSNPLAEALALPSKELPDPTVPAMITVAAPGPVKTDTLATRPAEPIVTRASEPIVRSSCTSVDLVVPFANSDVN
jgi:hypothetical protein